MVEEVALAADPIVISLEAYFHGIQTPNWSSKLIQFPRAGVLWGLHLSKQELENSNTPRLIGCLICFGPLKEHSSDWSIIFDHMFTISHDNSGFAGTVQKDCNFSESHHIITNYEWKDDEKLLPIRWKNLDSVILSCHLYISQINGIDEDTFNAAVELSRAQNEYTQQASTPNQVECQVMKCFGDLLLSECTSFSETSMEAAEKLALLFGFPNVTATIRNHLMQMQSKRGVYMSDNEESKKPLEFDLTGFDYPANPMYRKRRMDCLEAHDIISMFQQLCAIAFRK